MRESLSPRCQMNHSSRNPSTRVRITALFLAATVLALAACSDAGESRAIVLVEIVTVPNNQPLTDLVPGTTRELLGVPTNSAGNFVDVPVTFASTNSAVVTVTPEGSATAISGGAAYIRATAGERTDSVAFTVRLPVDSIDIAATPDTLRREGAHQLVLTLFDTQGNPVTGRTVVFTSSDESIATVSTDGNVLASSTNEGPVTITATVSNASDGGMPVMQSRTIEVFGDPAVETVEMSGAGGFWGNAAADHQLTATPRSGANNVVAGVTMLWSSSEPAVATVDATGLVTFVGGLGPVTMTAKTATFPGSPDTVSGSVDFEVATQLALNDSLVVPLIAEGESFDYAILGGATDSAQVTTFEGASGDVDLYIFSPGVLNPVANNNGGVFGQYLCRPWNDGSDENCTRVLNVSGFYRVRLYAFDGAGDVDSVTIRYRLKP